MFASFTKSRFVNLQPSPILKIDAEEGRCVTPTRSNSNRTFFDKALEDIVIKFKNNTTCKGTVSVGFYRDDRAYAMFKRAESTNFYNHAFNITDMWTIYIESELSVDNSALRTLKFPCCLDSDQRQILHLVAEREGLGHQSVGDGDERCIEINTL